MNEEERPARVSRAEAKQRTRAALIAAATEVIAREGLAGASVDAIAESAGFTVGAIYSQFGSKNGLVVAAMHEHVEERVAAARSIMESQTLDDSGTRTAMGRLLAVSAFADGELALMFWTELWLHAARTPGLAELMSAEARAVDDVIAESIRARRGTSKDAGGISDAALATVVSSLFRGLAQRRRLDPQAVPDELLGQALRLLVAGRQSLNSTARKDER